MLQQRLTKITKNSKFTHNLCTAIYENTRQLIVSVKQLWSEIVPANLFFGDFVSLISLSRWHFFMMAEEVMFASKRIEEARS